MKSAADWLPKYTLHLCPIRCSDPEINKNPDVCNLFRPTRKIASRFDTTSGTEIQTLKDINIEIKTLNTAQTLGQEYSKLGRLKEDKMTTYRRMFQAIWTKYW